MICTVYVYNENCAQAGRVVPGSAIEYANALDRIGFDPLAADGDLSGYDFPTWESMRVFFSERLADLPANASNAYTRRVARSVLDEIESF